MSAGTRLTFCNLWFVKTCCRKKLVANGICSRVKRHVTEMYAQCRCGRVDQARRDEGRRAPSATSRHQRPRAISDHAPSATTRHQRRAIHVSPVLDTGNLVTDETDGTIVCTCLDPCEYGFCTKKNIVEAIVRPLTPPPHNITSDFVSICIHEDPPLTAHRRSNTPRLPDSTSQA